MDEPLALAQEAADELRRRSRVDSFEVAVVLGSGWKAATERLGLPRLDLAATDLPGFQPSTVAGHDGRVLAVERDPRRLLVFLGRTHLYEGRGVAAVVHGVRTAVAAGCRVVSIAPQALVRITTRQPAATAVRTPWTTAATPRPS